MSQRGPEYAREWQWEPVRARMGEPERDRERASKSQIEPQRERQLEPEGARVGVTEASLTSLACT